MSIPANRNSPRAWPALLIEQEDFPQAIDVLKDAIKANPKDADPYQQLAYIYAKYLKKTDQAIDYANQAITSESSGHRRLPASGRNRSCGRTREKGARGSGSRHKGSQRRRQLWMRLGKLYVALLFKSDSQPKPDELKRTERNFQKSSRTRQR